MDQTDSSREFPLNSSDQCSVQPGFVAVSLAKTALAVQAQKRHSEQHQDKTGNKTAHDNHQDPHLKQFPIVSSDKEQKEENREQSIEHENMEYSPTFDEQLEARTAG